MHTECNSTMYTPRYAVLLQEQVDPAHYTATHYGTSIKSVDVRGVLHSVNDQPAIVRDSCWTRPRAGGPVIAWYQYNLIHRDGDKPSVVWGCIRRWRRCGVCHRDRSKPPYMNFATGELHWYVFSRPG